MIVWLSLALHLFPIFIFCYTNTSLDFSNTLKAKSRLEEPTSRGISKKEEQFWAYQGEKHMYLIFESTKITIIVTVKSESPLTTTPPKT